ncbi:threonylcarbamoyl-AMP synthase [Paenibacillus baekrokdamisoli]|uniref:Threonylcarbamoyl-AMP synthase n=1 Tax=Paenibacillus baekrokdamisoli TaxID=1712516 RepID=A0A3G9JFS8_9BACL|nr:L-threonylcarbamoyladenylate synthase [Paenibacillus baekrokdamisoli]MBB3069011.1 L-threonylcarbamoyladenylate synthase [Paenibacillus baekrokdamisoli]BBH23833.1 threonylcarbamoyl-AMP synthase [Paenibacillus baekrokdamisoli]
MSKTIVWQVNASMLDINKLEQAAQLLREGGTVAFPTETVYGLGADARSTTAVERIFMAKGRPADNPLIVHIADLSQLDELALPYGPLAKRLMDRFWPGPLTIVLPVSPGAVSPRVTAGLDTVAVRMPAHPVALALIAAAGCPVAAPSANRSGRPSPTQASHVLADLDNRIDGIVDGGDAGVGLESTVVEIDGEIVRILRPGGITAEALREVAAYLEYDSVAAPGNDDFSEADGALLIAESEKESEKDSKAAASAPRSPGMKYAHYAPQGLMQLVKGQAPAVSAYIQAEVHAARARGELTGVLAFAEQAATYDADHVLVVGSLAQLETAAHGLYAALRAFDDLGVQRIWAEACPEEGIGHALMNRLVKAAGHRIIKA